MLNQILRIPFAKGTNIKCCLLGIMFQSEHVNNPEHSYLLFSDGPLVMLNL